VESGIRQGHSVLATQRRGKMRSRKTWIAIAAAATVVATLVGCSAGTDPAAKKSGPVTIEVWGWDAETGKQVAQTFNKAQHDVVVKYVLQASNTATQTNFRNAFEAGQDLPCLVQGFAPLTTMVVNGWAEDISAAVKPSEKSYSEGALAAAKVNGAYYGVPAGSDGQFMIVNKDTFDKYGVKVPKTWDEFIAVGKTLHQHGVDVTNLAGEDPSTLLNLVQQA
jgi:multiple sugar transport system substrate-binding protein